MTRYLFFSGKGGVGKTTMAAATAIHRARSGKKTLIVTTDPASNLADVFEQSIGHRIAPIHGVPNLHAMEIDPDTATNEYKERLIGPYRGVMPEDVIASLEENLSGPCTTELASFDLFIDFMEGDEYDIIVFDTAPTGHTLRLLDLPFDYARQVEMMVSSAENTAVKQETGDRFREIIALLRDPERAVFSLVLYPESTPIMESWRAMLDLKHAGIETQLRALSGFRDESSLATWIYRIATNAALDHLRSTSSRVAALQTEISAAARPSGEGEAAQDEKTSLSDSLPIRKDMNDCIRGIVDNLPEPYRTPLVLSDIEGLTNAEVPGVLGISLDVAKIRRHRARTRLRKELSRKCAFSRDGSNELACDRKPL